MHEMLRRLERVEAKLDHQHKMLHALADAVAALAVQDGDMERLAAAGAELQLRRQQLQASLDEFVADQEQSKKSPETKEE